MAERQYFFIYIAKVTIYAGDLLFCNKCYCSNKLHITTTLNVLLLSPKKKSMLSYNFSPQVIWLQQFWQNKRTKERCELLFEQPTQDGIYTHFIYEKTDYFTL